MSVSFFFFICVCVRVPQEVTEAVSRSSPFRPLKHTPVNMCECLMCASLSVVRRPRPLFSAERIASGAVWSAVISNKDAETLKVTIALPLRPVNVTQAGQKKKREKVSLPKKGSGGGSVFATEELSIPSLSQEIFL